MKNKESIWVILDNNGNFCSFGTKVAWISSGAAKNAFSCHMREYINNRGIGLKIEDCPEYKLIEIKA